MALPDGPAMLKEEEGHHQLPHIDVPLPVRWRPNPAPLEACVRLIPPSVIRRVGADRKMGRRRAPKYRRVEQSRCKPEVEKLTYMTRQRNELVGTRPWEKSVAFPPEAATPQPAQRNYLGSEVE